MMRRPSLRSVVLVPTLLVIVVGAIGFGVYIDRVQYAERLADIDEELVRADRGRTLRPPATAQVDGQAPTTSTPDGVVDIPAVDDENGPEISDAVEVVTDIERPLQLVIAADGEVLFASQRSPDVAQVAAAAVGRSGTFTLESARLRVLVSPDAGGANRVSALSLDDADAARGDFRRALLIGTATIGVLQALVILVATTVAVRPVTRMARSATRIADGELDADIDPPVGSRETAELATDLDRMLGQLRATIEQSDMSAAEATAAREDMARFLADVSHEIRTPLTALRGYSDLYRQGMLDDPGALDRAMDRVGDESQRLHGLVNDMLHLVRGDTPLTEHERFDAGAVVEVVVADLRSAYPDRPIDLIFESTPCEIVGSPGDVHRALLNLGTNACQHSDSGAPVRMAVRSEAAVVEIEVADHGPGIAVDDLDKIFLPFYRVDRSRSRSDGGGAGLGLALVRQLLERNGGSIAVDTEPGVGTTFKVRFGHA